MENEDFKEQIVILQGRLSLLEQEQHRIDIQLVGIKSDLHYLKSGQDSLNSNLSRFLWIVGGGFIAAAITFIIRGGLNGQ